jgi:hypothetical protein
VTRQGDQEHALWSSHDSARIAVMRRIPRVHASDRVQRVASPRRSETAERRAPPKLPRMRAGDLRT